MILGLSECDTDTAYFLKNGEYPKNACKQSFIIEDWEHEDDLYREFQESNFYEYFQNTYKYCLWQ